MSEEKKLKAAKSVRELAYGMLAFGSASIFGPLLVFISLGYFLDLKFSTKPIFIIVGVVIAFVVTNALLLKRISNISKQLSEEDEQDKKKR